MKKSKELRIIEWGLWGIILLFIGTFLWINFFGFEQFATCDVYADTLYAMEAWESKSIFPEGWVFGNQFYIASTPVLCALLYGITGKINLSMILATSIMTVLLIFTLIWMLLPITTRLQRTAAVAIFLGGMVTCDATFSLEGQLLFLLASYYSCYLITLFLVIGDYIRALHNPKRPLLCGPTVCGFLLLIAMGMQSLRETSILILPLFALEALRFILNFLSRKNIKAEDLLIPGRVILYGIFNFFGLFFIRLMNVPNESIYGATVLRTANWAEAHQINLRILGKITGFYYVVHETNGWLYLIPAILFCGITLFSVCRGILRLIKTKRPEPLFLIQVFLIIGLVGLLGCNLLLTMNFRTPYLFIWYLLPCLSAVSLFEEKGAWKGLLAVLLIVGCLLNWITGYAPAIQKICRPEPSPFKEIANYLVQEEYQYLYGDWYPATTTALYTDGTVRACSFGDGLFQILSYINPQDKYGKEENEKAVYLLQNDQVAAALEYATQHGASLQKIAEFPESGYLLFTSDRPLMYHP